MILLRLGLFVTVFLASFTPAAKCQEAGREAVEKYLLKASDRRENLAYRFEAQLGYSKEGEEPRVRIVEGVAALSKAKSVEYYASSTVRMSSSLEGTGEMMEFVEYLRLRKKRFQKIYLSPVNVNESKWSKDAITSNTSAAWHELGVDGDSNPVVGVSLRFCPLGLPLSSAISVLRNETDVDHVANGFFTIFEFKEEREEGDKLIAEWYAVNRLGLETVVLDPKKEYLPILKTSRVFDAKGSLVNTLEYRTKTKWTKVEEEHYPSEVILTHRSKGLDYEWVFKFEYLPQSVWDKLASTTDWEKMTEEKGEGLTRVLHKEFDTRRKETK